MTDAILGFFVQLSLSSGATESPMKNYIVKSKRISATFKARRLKLAGHCFRHAKKNGIQVGPVDAKPWQKRKNADLR